MRVHQAILLALLPSICVAGCWSLTPPTYSERTAPTVSSTSPADGESNVLLDRKIAVTFSEMMDRTTITPATFTLKHDGVTVDGNVSYAGVTAVFRPVRRLAPGTIYRATITTGAFDAGLPDEAMAVDKSWSFTTIATTETVAREVKSVIPGNGGRAGGSRDNRERLAERTRDAGSREPMNTLKITGDTFTFTSDEAKEPR